MDCAIPIWITWVIATGNVGSYEVTWDGIVQPHVTENSIQLCLDENELNMDHTVQVVAIDANGVDRSEPSVNTGTIREMWHPDAPPPTPTATPTSSPTSTPVATPSYCVACGLDANRDGVVGFKDFGELLGKYGTCVDHEQQVEVPCE
jgi:hypothetical protein